MMNLIIILRKKQVKEKHIPKLTFPEQESLHNVSMLYGKRENLMV